MGSVDIELIVN